MGGRSNCPPRIVFWKRVNKQYLKPTIDVYCALGGEWGEGRNSQQLSSSATPFPLFSVVLAKRDEALERERAGRLQRGDDGKPEEQRGEGEETERGGGMRSGAGRSGGGTAGSNQQKR